MTERSDWRGRRIAALEAQLDQAQAENAALEALALLANRYNSSETQSSIAGVAHVDEQGRNDG